MPWTIRIAMLVAGILVALSAVGFCSTRPATYGAHPTTLRIGVLPDLDREQLQRQHGPLVARLRLKTGLPCELVIPDDYADLVARFGRGELDLAWFNALTFLDARDEHGAVPVARRDVDARLTTVFVVRPEGAIPRLEDMKGRRLALGERLSTSGNLMARHYLLAQGLDPTKDFSSHRHATHDATANHVRDGRADLGAMNALHLDALYESGELSRDDVVIIDRSFPYVDCVWAAQQHLPPDFRRTIREALLELDPIQDEDAVILKAAQCLGFVPALLEDFDRARDIANKLDSRGSD